MKNFHDDIKEKNSSGKANRTAIRKHSQLNGDPSIWEGTITSWKLEMQISFKHLGNHKPKDRQDPSIFGYTQSKARPHLGGYGSLVKPPASQGDLGIHIQMEEDMEIDHEETVTIPEDCCLASSGSVSVDEGDKSPPTPLVLQKLQNPGTELLSYFRHLQFPPSKPRRKCLPRRFTVAQVTILQAKFQENPYISREEKLTMAMTFGSTPLQIKRWFKNQREVQRRSFKRTFTDVKRNLLMARFQENPYPSEEDEEYLAMVTGLTKTKIRDWFSYKRCLQGKSNN
ncbi:Protein CBG25725 [Caenorhabditis briggsae]|uniref:Protein CBG25725 n=1 Tax=Caenorhabditis briggsae TaxID=6238 RepID=B6IGY8_CAEBR|nr:Protein CBG25725 [Caenorhabditis briggsae]CAR99168.1 Protein CBG25725 [Caenorhabditis briggsae]